MKIAILSRGPRLYTTRRLREAATSRGHKVRVLDTLDFAIVLEAGKPQLVYRGRELERFDAVIPRIGASINLFGTAVVRQFELTGVFSLNPSNAISVARDKLRSIQALSRHDIGIAPTAFARNRDAVIGALERIGGAPVVVKLLEGTQGIGVVLAETMKVAEAMVETLQSAKQHVLLQRFVSESKGRDIRALVVGGEVVAAMRRRAVGDEFRSNVHRGGKPEPVQLDSEYARTAVRAAQIHGLRVAGVDMLEARDGPKVLEVNGSPGLEGIERATKLDIADSIIQHMEDQVLFPTIDIHQRLTLDRGYGVSEIDIGRRSALRNRTIAETDLRERDVIVLSILRGGISIPAPHGSERILQGDTLVCYGKLMTLKTLIPPRPRVTRRKLAPKPLPDDPGSEEAASLPGEPPVE